MATEATQLSTSFFAGQAKITSAGTAQQLPNLNVTTQISLKSKIGNNAAGIAIGSIAALANTFDGTGNGTFLFPGESMTILVANANAIWWNTANAADVLTWQGS